MSATAAAVTDPPRTSKQIAFTLPVDLATAIKVEAVHSDCWPSDIVTARLRESYARLATAPLPASTVR